jgi:hypothetical protein
VRQLAATIKARWVCEQAHQQLKEELGLDHFEGRSWRGLHRHALMTLIAFLFLQQQRLTAAKRGKKKQTWTTAATQPAGHPLPIAGSARAGHAAAMSDLPSPLHARLSEKSAKVVRVSGGGTLLGPGALGD